MIPHHSHGFGHALGGASGFLASVPSRLILETPDLLLLTASVGIAIVTVFISTRFWRYALKQYSSASS